ncbi:LysR substrate-binding domain-containing protein [Coralliovum pocilloporae]|uniref:LysR substrate-binding domain-containing protein n=1 Tax=Coralliovum pocilloporae TaxID=3066369 RepID=UPI0033078578
MTYQLPPLNWLRAFEAAARHLSFTAAADELGLTQTAISYQVRSLEKTLGYALFDRLPRSIKLTDMGKAYLPSVRKAFGELSTATTGLFTPKREKALTVRCSASFAVFWLAPRLPRFKAEHPEIDLRLTSTLWADSGFHDDVDVEVHYGDGRWSRTDTEIVLNQPVIPVCAPALAKQHGIETVADLVRLPFIDILGCEEVWPAFKRRHDLPQGPSEQAIKVDNSVTGIEVAASGGGLIMVLPCFAERAIAEGRLIQPVDANLPNDLSHYLMMPTDPGAITPEVRLFRDWILSANDHSAS